MISPIQNQNLGGKLLNPPTPVPASGTSWLQGNITSQNLGQPFPSSLAGWVPRGSAHRLLLHIALNFPWQLLYVSGIRIFLNMHNNSNLPFHIPCITLPMAIYTEPTQQHTPSMHRTSKVFYMMKATAASLLFLIACWQNHPCADDNSLFRQQFTRTYLNHR